MCEHVTVKLLRGRAECGAEGEGRRDGWRKGGMGALFFVFFHHPSAFEMWFLPSYSSACPSTPSPSLSLSLSSSSSPSCCNG
ncbi:Vacuolar protein sorting-associated protein 13D [Dissostichus eleginoides]|uniref:Vacuolar protein sorting-associated protein 13D n=1 Tax=Dissostichus eleginoides TaxID=100907 RepID=A0AAD9F3E7_DISEL|nr:Vacuolar protein sorting-associated protein 13D [Dissostichus eleginoides]